MKYFIDTEFHEYKTIYGVDTIELISIGIVDENGRAFYAVSSEFNVEAAFENEWLRKNVLPSILSADLKSREEIRDGILSFTGGYGPAEFYGYYADYDWVVFCWLFGRMIDLPKGFPMYCLDLKQIMDDQVAATWEAVKDSTYGHQGLTLERFKKLPGYPTQENEHNALDDARWNLALYKWLQTQPAKDIHRDPMEAKA